MKKNLQNINIVVRKLKPNLTKIINLRLKVAKEEIVERQKEKAIPTKCHRDRRGICVSSKK